MSAEIITQYFGLPVDSDEKPNLIHSLWNSPDEKVSHFYIRIIEDENEYDLARIEAIKLIPLRPLGEDLKMIAALGLIKVIKNDDDDLVRQYAASALYRFVEIEGVLALIECVVRDDEEDSLVRHNALGSLESADPLTDCVKDLMRRLISVGEFREVVERILKKWHLEPS